MIPFIVHIFYITIILLLIIILLVTKMHSSSSSSPFSPHSAHLVHSSPPSLKGAYLNYSSTNAKKSGMLNPSDLAYPQNFQLRADIERLENKIRKLINAPVDSKVIINSGATESIANCVFWAKSYNKYGTIVGTKYDHSAVRDNCKTFEVEYDPNLNSNSINERCSMIFLTHVNSKTGEILDIPTFKKNFDNYSFMNDGANSFQSNINNPFNKTSLQYKPLVVLDAAQSIMKIPIDMERWGLNAVFFSLHKIGGPIGLGVLVIKDTVNAPFKPLISGKQQHSLRGGTFPLQHLLEYEYIFDDFDDLNDRREKWESTMKKLKKAGLNVYSPTGKHLYNTFLVSVEGCPLGIINSLASKGIYIGNTSACKNEEIINNTKSESTMSGGDSDPFENAIRISFLNSDELTDSIVNDIIDECKRNNEK